MYVEGSNDSNAMVRPITAMDEKIYVIKPNSLSDKVTLTCYSYS